MYIATMLIVLGKGGHGVENKSISAATEAKKSVSFALLSTSGSLFQRVGAALRNDYCA